MKLRKNRRPGNRAPTKDEAGWIVAIKSGPCVACYGRTGGRVWRSPCDAHHLTSGGVRVGHMATVGLCGWCHRRIPDAGYSIGQMLDWIGPSLLDGSKAFHANCGMSDAELLALQTDIINEGGERMGLSLVPVKLQEANEAVRAGRS